MKDDKATNLDSNLTDVQIQYWSADKDRQLWLARKEKDVNEIVQTGEYICSYQNFKSFKTQIYKENNDPWYAT